MNLKNLSINYAGIIAGTVYGILMRLIFNFPAAHTNFSFTDLFSITFVWIVPFVMGITPMLFANRKQLSSIAYPIYTPALCVLFFFAICFATQIEDLICILILSIPFLACAAIGGLIFAKVILGYRNRKGIIYSVFIMPILVGVLEVQFTDSSQVFEIKTNIIINASPDVIWNNIVRVKEIKDEEYTKGFFNYAGIPRPLFAELDKDTITATRIGHFEGGLQFKETVTEWQRNKVVTFDIQVITSSIRKAVFDEHVLTGNHFKFLNAAYEIEQLDKQRCKLVLTSSYRLDTKINFYASLWGNNMLTDFQERLLDVIKKRTDRRNINKQG